MLYSAAVACSISVEVEATQLFLDRLDAPHLAAPRMEDDGKDDYMGQCHES